MITERIFHWAKQTPYNTAIVYNGQRLSYRSFARSIAKARSFFAGRGFSGAGYALLAVHNLRDFWILSLALRSLGLTTLAMRSSAAVQQLLLPDIRLVATLPAEAWPELNSTCDARGLPLLSLQLEGERSLPLEVPGPCHPPGGHIVWTSGTTGHNKMVLLGPDDDAYFLSRRVEIAGMTQNSVLCMFDISGASAAGFRWTPSPWFAGGATLFEQGAERSHALRRPGITHAMMNPAMLTRLLAEPTGAFSRNDAMRLFITGGTMTRAQVEQTKARLTQYVFNVLASTEAGPIAVTSLDTPDDHRWHRLLSYCLVGLVDESGHPTPAGEMGQVRVGLPTGHGGYVNDESATREFFKDGFFYPGDLAIMGEDRRMALQGRVTDVINVQGKKVSPAQFEERLVDIFDATGACLFSTRDDRGEEELHVVLEAVALPELRLLRDVLREFRGFNKAIVYFVAQMSRNQMGKVVRRDVRAQTRTISGQTVRW